MSDRIHAVEASWAPKALLRSMSVREELGRPFEYKVEFLSTQRDIAPSSALGAKMSVSLKIDEQNKRYFHGLVSQFMNVGPRGQFQLYWVTLRPWIWFLQYAGDCRIFQKKDLTAILKAVFSDRHGLSDHKIVLNGVSDPYEYCVQYRESDFDFVSRLMEREGVYYYVAHEAQKHVIHILNTMADHPSIIGETTLPYRPPGEAYVGLEHVHSWRHQVQIQTGKVLLKDFDFEKPRTDLLVAQSGTKSHPFGNLEFFDYPGKYLEVQGGDRYAKLRLEEKQAGYTQIEGSSNCMRLATGYTFTLDEHPRSSENAKYLITGTEIEIESGEIEQFSGADNRFELKFKAVRATDVFRPQRTTPKPVIFGPQTAIVTGPSDGASDIDVWTDVHGRVKVQFHWDRLGQNDDQSSCWIRVSQSWAGKSWGAIHLPRIGQEVIVEFLEGDPDQPIITGRVYNNEQKTPYVLPDHGTQSGIKSRSTPQGDTTGFNELRFEDKKGEEEVYFHAEKNFTRVVENSDSETIGFDKKDPGDQTIKVFNNQVIEIGHQEANEGSQTETIFRHRTTTLKEGSDTLKIEKGFRETEIQKHDHLTLKEGNQEITIKVGDQIIKISQGKCSIEAATEISLVCGASSIKLTPSSIQISSTDIAISADASASMKGGISLSLSGAVLQAKADGMMEIKGGIVQIN